jgi:uncharacterized repeat protein (TIGR01451 family)
VVSTSAGCPNATLPITLPAGYTLSGRVTCNDAGIGNVFVYAEPEGSHDPSNSLPGYGVFTVDDGSYGLPLVSGTYVLTFTPPAAAGLNAEAFTTIELVTDTVLNVDFCVCGGVWVTETVDSAGDTGYQSSLALAPTYPYTPHISYYHSTSHYLKYAWLNNTTWHSETIDSGSGATSLALVPTYPYSPCISYEAPSYVYLACRKGETWTTMVVPYTVHGCCPSLALEPLDPYTPHVGYHWGLSTEQTQYHAYLSGTTWCSGTWEREWIEPPLSKVGWNSSLALEPTYPHTPHISYRDNADDDLKYAWKSGAVWLSETVDSVGCVGTFSSLALDSSNDPCISYLDQTNGALKYAWLSGTIWLSETVDSIGQPPYNRGRSSLELDQSDMPHISYYDATGGDLKLARFDGRAWIIQTVDSGGDVGQFSSLALDPVGCPHISYYDATNGDLKYAHIPPLADLAIVKSSHAPTVTCGDRLTYTLRLTNTGDAHLHAVITDTLPAHVTSTGELTWTPPVICPGDSWTQTVVVTVEMGYEGPLTNEVEVATREGAAGEAGAMVYVEARRIYLPVVLKNWVQ